MEGGARAVVVPGAPPSMVDWSTLPGDILRCVGDCILATHDIDYYMDMRAVCHNWRSATDDPRAKGVVDPRFRPRRWVMLDQTILGDHASLFFNLSTGRFLRRHLKRDWMVSATSDGLLVLGDGILNPFTGSLLRFDEALLFQDQGVCMVAVMTDDDPPMLFMYNLSDENVVWCAEPTTAKLYEQHFRPSPFDFMNMVSHAGDVYLVSEEGKVIKTVGTVKRCPNGELLLDTSGVVVVPPYPKESKYTDEFYLVDCSASELLLVRRRPEVVIEVFRVDVEKKALEPVRNIGGRALFVAERCLCVDASILPYDDGNCIYYYRKYGMFRHDLTDGKEEEISGELVQGEDSYYIRPFSIVQLLLAYCGLDDFDVLYFCFSP